MAAKRRRRRKAVARANPRRRRKSAARSAPRRRRRRAVAVARANPPRRRRRRHVVARANPSRRRRGYRRNPPGGMMGQVTEGLQDGLAVVGGQVIARKLATGVAAMVPTPTNATIQKVQYVGLRLAAAIGVAMASKKFAPKYSRMMTAGAFSEAINAGLAQTPIAPFLAAIPRRRGNPALAGRRINPAIGRVAAWPAAIPASTARAGVGAWARRGPGLPSVQG